MKLSWDGGHALQVGSRSELVRVLARLDHAALEFLVLEDGRHRFAQAGAAGSGFVLELRDAVAGTHLRSARTDLPWSEVQGCLSDWLDRTPGWEGRLEWVPAPLDGRRAKGLGHGGSAGLRRSGWIVAAFGLLALGGGALQQQKTADFLANVRQATGEVVAAEAVRSSRSDGRGGFNYDVQVRFLAADGAAYLARGSTPSRPAPGARLTVLYDGRDPAHRPTIDTDVRHYSTTIALAIPGALAVLIGAGMVLWSRRGRRR